MQLDRTEVVVRQRSSLELMDLSMLVLKRHFGKLALAAALVGFPLLLVDVLLLKWMISEDALISSEVFGDPEIFAFSRYVSNLCILFVMQFPIISLPVTLFLGAQIFYIPVNVKEIWRNLRQVFWPTVFVLGIVRMGLVGIIVQILIRDTNRLDGWEGILMFVAFPIVLLVRTLYPFAPEIIGLERCPLKANSNSVVSYSSRRSNLHNPLQSTLISRMVLANFYGILLLLMIVGVALFLQATLTGSWAWNNWFYTLVLPVALWIVGIFLSVYRFLSYIDSRIRLEGWEVELRVRAEANRLEQTDRPTINSGSVALEGAQQ